MEWKGETRGEILCKGYGEGKSGDKKGTQEERESEERGERGGEREETRQRQCKEYGQGKLKKKSTEEK